MSDLPAKKIVLTPNKNKQPIVIPYKPGTTTTTNNKKKEDVSDKELQKFMALKYFSYISH